jgi:competence protein ComEC
MSARQSLDLEIEKIEANGTVLGIAAGLRLTVFDRRDSHEDVQEHVANHKPAVLPKVYTYGQRLRFPVKLRIPRNFRNPGAWDYRGYLRQEGIVSTGSVADDKIEVLPGNAGSPIALWGSRARRSVVGKIHSLWPMDKSNQAGLFDAMLIGERSFIGRETNAAWQRTGIYHILVVSGMNVGILAAFIFMLLRRARAGEVVATVITIVLATGYAYLADLGAPVLRAVLMLAIVLLTKLLYRERALLNGIGLAALVLLAAEPQALFEASFQLTFLSVLAIAGIAVPQRFFDDLRHVGVDVRATVSFSDHHRFTPTDVARIGKTARAEGCAAVLTTEKDATRLRRFRSLPVRVLAVPLRIAFDPPEHVGGWLADRLAFARTRRRAA